ncbi:MAG TPA: hypothetical protein DEO33_05365 [Rikenellaceae bacterium]|nr:hypothetical protein [Rikenellaceae bacterium]
MSERTSLVIAGSYWQIPIIKKIKSMGHRALVVNPYEDSPAFPYADGHLQADIFDFERCLAYCKEQDVSAVISDESDIAMPVVACLANELGVPSLGVESARLFTDKFMMREFSKKNGLLYPEYRMCSSPEDAIELLQQIRHKLIIKPLDSNSSRGVFIVSSEEEIIDHFEEALSYSKVEKAVIAERYIEGTEFTIDGIKTPSKHYSLAISEKKHYAHNNNIASELLFAHTNTKYDYQKLREVNDKFVELSGLPFGLTHAEYKFEAGNFYLIEIAARGGGNLISADIVPFMSGVDNYEYLVNCSFGYIEEPDFTVPAKYKNRCAVLKFFDTPANGGLVKKIQGCDYLESEPDIIRYKFNFAIGDIIEPAQNDSKRIGFYIACSENMDKLQTVMQTVHEKIKIVLI